MPIYHFEVMRRRPGPARDLVSQLRLYSKQFMAHVETSDSEMMVEVSKKAWETMVSLFNFLRNEQDAGRLSATYMSTETAILAKKLNIAERDAMLQNKKLDRRHQNFSAISLREALNKTCTLFNSKRTGPEPEKRSMVSRNSYH